ncbi:MAG: hypothetical protein Cons2KO_07980 [Congregibacter sp.]
MNTPYLRGTRENRTLRFAIATALSLGIAYGAAVPLPYLTPLFVALLSTAPGPPLGPKALFVLLCVASLALAVGLLLIPMLRYYPGTAVLVIGMGLYVSMYLTVIAGKRVLGMFLTVGFTFVSVAGVIDYALATMIITSLLLAIGIAVMCLWVVYPLFPDRAVGGPAQEPPAGAAVSNWLALRAALIVLPAYLLALTNPSQYLMTIMKSVSLGQQTSVLDARHAGRELIGSTFVGGILAVACWQLLTLAPTLWMFVLWMLLFALYVGAKLYGFLPTRYAPSFWVNALVTMIILLGPAVEDSAGGKDAMQAFLVRFATFIGVTLYAWAALVVLENLRRRRQRKRGLQAAC